MDTKRPQLRGHSANTLAKGGGDVYSCNYHDYSSIISPSNIPVSRDQKADALAAIDWQEFKLSVLYGLSSPIEPNWTRKPAVINNAINSTFWHGASNNGLSCACNKNLKEGNQ